jgi:hypothetical protein
MPSGLEVERHQIKNLKGNYSRTIPAKFCLTWHIDFVEKYSTMTVNDDGCHLMAKGQMTFDLLSYIVG